MGKFTLKRRAFVLAAPFLSSGLARAADAWPNKPVKYINVFPPGGPTDTLSRIVCNQLSELTGQQFIIDNKAGSGGNIGTDAIAKSAPDGYTILMATNAQVAINPSIYAKMTYDPAKDLLPISQAVYSPNILVVPNDVPAKTVAELVAYAHTNPGKLSFASAGVGTTQHLAGELFKAMAHIDIQHVPYRGAGPMITDLLGGRITMAFIAIAPTIPLVREGRLRALAVTSAKRFGAAPELPSMIEAGYPDFESILSVGLMAPAGTPPAIIEKIHQDTVKALAPPDVRKKLSDICMEVIGNSPAEFAAALKAEAPLWAKVIKDAGIAPSN